MSMSADVLVVGAGPAGLALALLLLRHGLSVRIIDRSQSLDIGQRGAGIHPRTLELYKILGILPDVEKRTSRIPTIRLFTAPEGDGPVKELEMIDPLPERPQYHRINTYILGQDEHQALLRDLILGEFGCSVELRTQLVSFEQQPNQNSVITRLTKTYPDSEEAVEEVAAFRWLVGADGAHSTIRKQLGLSFLGQSHDVDLAVGDIEVQGLDPNASRLSLRPYTSETGKKMGFYMMGGANIDTEHANSSYDNLVNTLLDVIGKRHIQFGNLLASGRWKANVRMVDKFGEGRVFIVGDAAHVHSPTGGQGMNSAVQDAFNLGWKLALVHKKLAPYSLLDSYTAERVPVIASILDISTSIMNSNWAKINISKLDGWSRNFEVRQFGINYRRSGIVVEGIHEDDEPVDPFRSGLDGTLKAGDRAHEAFGLVDPANGEKKSLFDIFNAVQHTVIIFSSSIMTGAPLYEALQRSLTNLGISRATLVKTHRHISSKHRLHTCCGNHSNIH
ncbi:hypothetical protein VNI00_003731 [Paramarasmius palmivorus]|uniref:FAD-binding domain-containing protein n=1 Tax=Paramarasmius palmivorus TaxID=297713 RepID=A0AAW0DVF8_9AGAR